MSPILKLYQANVHSLVTLEILLLISRNPPATINMTGLANHCGVGTASITGSSKSLNTAGLANWTMPGDLRERFLVLTPKGAKLAREITDYLKAREVKAAPQPEPGLFS